MPRIHLQPRLAKLADWIPTETTRLVDVGCDHGKLSAYCLQNQLVQSVLATDLRSAPLARAQALLQRVAPHADWITHCGYGLENCSLHSGDCVVIAGMGGLEIRDILTAIPEEQRQENVCFLLHPTRAAEELRSSLTRLKLRIDKECLCAEQGRVYPILRVRPDPMPPLLDPITCFWGPYLLEAYRSGDPDPLWSQYEEKQRIALAKRSNNPRNPIEPAVFLSALQVDLST